MKCPNCDTLAAETDDACSRCRTSLNGARDPDAANRVGQVVLATGVCVGGMLAQGAGFKGVLPFVLCTVVLVMLFGMGLFRKSR